MCWQQHNNLSRCSKAAYLQATKMAEALTRVSELFTKIAFAKKEAAKAKEQKNRLQANLLARITTHLPRVAVPPPRVDVPVPRVTVATQADCCTAQIVTSTSVMQPVVQAPATCSLSWSPGVNAQPSTARPNYILQNKDDNNPPPPSDKPQGQKHEA
jgi:hypothetical protein